MNQQIVDYLQQNKGSHTQESLVAQLRTAGHNDVDINTAVQIVYGGGDASSVQVKYAGFWIRFVAVCIDGIIVGICSSIFIIPLALAFGEYGGLIIPVLQLIVMIAYTVLMTNKYQATLGKMAVGVKVCDANTLQKASSGNIFMREAINRTILAVPFANILFPLIIAFTAKKQGVHDFAAKTVVVYKDPNKKMSGVVIAVIIFIVGLVVIAIIGILASIVLVSLNSARDKAQEASVKSSVSSTVPAAILCMDDGYDLTSPVPGMAICSGSEGVWPPLDPPASWGVMVDGGVSDGSFEYTATYGPMGEYSVSCTEYGCAFSE